jgi:ATP-dependent Lon protease
VILPRDNEKDLPDVPDQVRREMQFVFAERVEQVIANAIPQLEAQQATAS